MQARESSGYSLIELMAAVSIALTLAAASVPSVLGGLDDSRAAGAARYLSGRLYDARFEAVQRAAEVALRVETTNGALSYAVYADGNRNGVLARDIQQNLDRPIRALERLPNLFSGVDFGTIPGLPPVDAGSPAPDGDPIKLGSGNMVSFSALGTASPGSLYIKSRGNVQYVVRVYGATAKIRVLRFDSRARQWKPV